MSSSFNSILSKDDCKEGEDPDYAYDDPEFIRELNEVEEGKNRTNRARGISGVFLTIPSKFYQYRKASWFAQPYLKRIFQNYPKSMPSWVGDLDTLIEKVDKGKLKNRVVVTSNQDLVSGSVFGWVVPIPTFQEQYVSATLNILRASDVVFARLVTCDFDSCEQFKSHFDEEAQKAGLQLLSSDMINPSFSDVAPFLASESRVIVLYGGKNFLQNYFEHYSPEILSNLDTLQFFIVTENCEEINEVSTNCDPACVASLWNVLKGSICIERKKLTADVLTWQQKMWNPRTIRSALREEEKPWTTSEDGWSGSNMDINVPVIYDTHRWIVKTVTENVIEPNLVEHLNDDLIMKLMNDTGFQGIVVSNPQKPLDFCYCFFEYSNWNNFATISSAEDAFKVSDLDNLFSKSSHDEKEWFNNSYQTVDTDKDTFQLLTFAHITSLLVLAIVFVLLERTKIKLQLGVLSKIDNLFVSGMALIGVSICFLSHIWWSDNGSRGIDIIRNGVTVVQTMMIVYMCFCFKSFRAIYFNRQLKLPGLLSPSQKLLRCLAVGAFLWLIMSFVIPRGSKLSYELEDVLIQSEDNAVEVFRLNHYFIHWIGLSCHIVNISELMIIVAKISGLGYLTWICYSSVIDGASSLKKKNRRTYLKFLVFCYSVTFSFLVLRFLLELIFVPKCRIVDEANGIVTCNRFDTIKTFPMLISIFDMIEISMCAIVSLLCELVFTLVFEYRKTHKSTRKYVVSHDEVFGKKTNGTQIMRRLDVQKAQVPEAMVIVGDRALMSSKSMTTRSVFGHTRAPTLPIGVSLESTASIDFDRYGGSLEVFANSLLSMNVRSKRFAISELKRKLQWLCDDWLKQQHIIELLTKELDRKLDRHIIFVVRAKRLGKQLLMNPAVMNFGKEIKVAPLRLPKPIIRNDTSTPINNSNARPISPLSSSQYETIS
eukprot:TRINITY_DN3623_c0_g2_i4.p1 TRINITY_DN3623_c0_g2~~TRINITY_DN3623_c0_g2_i4.p1  ORF type:complete len:937 (-),score=185.58 TRINITY_DN3623_c0_g2_i4:619-3429(-)